jgi:hypothetical protein
LPARLFLFLSLEFFVGSKSALVSGGLALILSRIFSYYSGFPGGSNTKTGFVGFIIGVGTIYGTITGYIIGCIIGFFRGTWPKMLTDFLGSTKGSSGFIKFLMLSF